MTGAGGLRPGRLFQCRCTWSRRTDTIAHATRLIALVYLVIGLYVLFRRWTAPKSTHFYVFCLVSFVLYAFRSTGEPGVFDRVIYWGNLLANALQPALFLHFAVSLRRMQEAARREAAAGAILLYVPGAVLAGLQVWAMSSWSATELLSHRLDQTWCGLYGAVLRNCGGGLPLALYKDGVSAGAAATEVADAGDAAGGGPIYAAVRGAVSERCRGAGAVRGWRCCRWCCCR